MSKTKHYTHFVHLVHYQIFFCGELKNSEALANFFLNMDIENFARPQPHLSDTRPTIVQPHQFRGVELTDGPHQIPRFRAHKWTFHVRGNTSIRLTTHHFDTPEVRSRVLGEFEYFLRTALERCADDGAAPDDIIHIYLDCDWWWKNEKYCHEKRFF